MEITECIVLAGGFGTRLQPLVKDVPKCMAEVADHPFLYYLLKYLERQEVDHVILALGYKSEIVTKWLNTNNFKFVISYAIEKEPLGTGGAIRYAFDKAKTDKALVINGDTFFDINIKSLFDFHSEKKADISLALKPMSKFDRYGMVIVDGYNRIIKFTEKQYQEQGLINGGTYLLNKSVLKDYDKHSAFSFEKEVLEKGINDLNIFGMVQDRYFIDIGIPEDYEKANIDFPQFNI